MLHTLESRDLLEKALSLTAPATKPDSVKLLFAPPRYTKENREQMIRTYASLVGLRFEAVFVVEEVDKPLEKRISMPDLDEFNCVYGPVSAHDALRNEFADEDDDLYVDNGGVHGNMAVFHQLPFLMAALGDFSVVSVQIYKHERPGIIKELAYVIEEILGERSALVVLCCDLAPEHVEGYKRVMEYVEREDTSNLFNVLNSGAVPMEGHGPFLTGMLVCKAWGLVPRFDDLDAATSEGASLVAGTASFQLRMAMG